MHINGIVIQSVWLILLLANTSISTQAAAKNQGAAFQEDLIVKITNIKPAGGDIICALFNSKKDFPTKLKSAVAHTKATGTTAERSCVFTATPDGHYAIAVMHDENNNGKLDKNILGIPKEGWGVSGNSRPKLRAPRYNEAKFYWLGESTELPELIMRY